jgi:2'-5' RNA ligase
MRRRIKSLQSEWAALDPDVKWVEPQNMHLTLQFLGEIDARDSVDVCRAVRSVAGRTPPFSISLAGVGGFPNLRRPRTLWVGIDVGRAEVIRLHEELATLLEAVGEFRREERGYAPHVTLGRVKGNDATIELRQRLTEDSDWYGGEQTIDQIHVMSSELNRDGPVYSVVGHEQLRGRAVE